MRSIALPLAGLCLLALSACNNGDGNFSTNTDGPDVVEGAGDLSLDAGTLVWTELETGVSIGNTLVFENVGDLNLIIYEARIIDSAGGTFYLGETEDVTIAPGGSFDMTLTATLPGDKPKYGTLRVKTNDLDYLEFTVDLEAYPTGWDTGDTGDTGPDTGDTGAGGDTGDTGSDTGDTGRDTGE